MNWTPLFTLYTIGMVLSVVFCVRKLWPLVIDRNPFALRLFYAAAIFSAHVYVVPISHNLGRQFYEYCGLFQFFILMAALAVQCEATIPVGVLSLAACLTNTLSYYNYPSHEGIWVAYFSIINTVQTAQIASLVFFSPLSIAVIAWYVRVRKNKGKQPWMLRRSLKQSQ